ncbi:hypothetical protein CY35_11G034500 [Sphagnum magellanicum]|nr:hypothetical protein CY35_11G034500 [Sphagnum magellanicum]KAH9547443.1 hypothetical protein CY35_11G034500 [Sphagnum magellanicum]
MSEHKSEHDPIIDDYNRARLTREQFRMLAKMHEEKLLAAYGQSSGTSFTDPFPTRVKHFLDSPQLPQILQVLGQPSGTSFTDPFPTRLPSSIPSDTSMSEHKRKHDSTTDDDNRAGFMREWLRMRSVMAEEKLPAILQAAYESVFGTSITDRFPTRAMSSSIEWSSSVLKELLGQRSGTSFTDPFHTRDVRARDNRIPPTYRNWNLGANPSVWAPNPSMDNARIVSEIVQLPGEELLVLCKDRPRVEPHSSGITGNWIEVKPRDGKPPLLAGCVTVTLEGGKGRLDNLHFTDNSSFVRNRSFRLGFKAHLGSHIQGALSTAICVKDARGKSNVKKEIPEEDDTVDVLVNIAKNGARLRKLNDCGIKTVKQLSLFYEKDPKALRDVLKDMPKKSFDATIKNAEKCRPVLEPALQMTQNQTMISAGAKEGSAVISVPKDVPGRLMSGDRSKFNVLDNEHNLSLGHPQGDHLNPPAGLPMSSHSGEPGVGLQSLAFQPPVGTDCLNETAVHTDGIDSETIFRQFLSSLDAVDFSAASI